MGIWIRSQGGLRLINTSCIFIYEGNKGDWNIGTSGVLLGTYTDKSEAMKVLDMIEAALGSQTVFHMSPAGFSEEEGE
jgi:hypothetical protein